MEQMDGFTKSVVIVLCSLMASISSCSVAVNYQDDGAVERLVKAGADPIDALCAVRNTTNEELCKIRVSVKGK